MALLNPPGARHDQFTKWAKRKGVKIHGVTPAKIPGRGLGIVAQRRIEAGEELVSVPLSALLTIKVIPKEFKAKHKGITVHGLLASFLAFGGEKKSQFDPWKATWPTMQDFEESMPLLWPSHLRDFLNSKGEPTHDFGLEVDDATSILPPAINGRWNNEHMMQDYWQPRESSLLHRQEKKLDSDWEIVSRIFPDQTKPEYTYYWLVVNTRSFYFDLLGGSIPEDHDDRMVMCPFVDYFNHHDHGCDVAFDKKGYTVTSDRSYDVGEEIYTSYGSHSNDFLLVEYGFILDENKWDSLPLDDFFDGDQLPGPKKIMLKNLGYFGNYTLTSEGVCHRTQVAVRASTLERRYLVQFVETGETTAEHDQLDADTFICVDILQRYYEDAETAIERLWRIEDRMPSHVRQTLILRWEQIKVLIRAAFESGIGLLTQARMHVDFDALHPYTRE